MEWRIWFNWWIIFCIWYLRLFWIYLKKHGEKTDNASIIIYVNKIENIITFKIKAGYYPEHLTAETMKLLGSTNNKITNNENSENVPHLAMTDVVLLHCNIVNNN